MDNGKYVEEICRAMIKEFEEKEHFTLDEGVKAIKDLYRVKEECNWATNIANTIDNIINDIANKICIGGIAASIFKYKKIRDKITIDKDNVIWYDGFERVGIASGIKNITEKKTNDIEEILIEKNNGKSIRINDKAFVLGWE
ncbi:hypothetical protein [Clostridium uliginosum]|uniref:Uncharacterized protein n=1 Tax=Clostridium uliginosum TaxID=119641 RepID=A0A1I1HH79_9CLOT|nr:hypothetical protein [Clostridium uliginosum]SFC23387.1 hypothetical protein SAMN05421842_101312 [Clostridium uliginosum]